jgi:hypothetical protein
VQTQDERLGDGRTPAETAAVTRHLKSTRGSDWKGRRDYSTMTLSRVQRQFDDVYRAVKENTDADTQTLTRAYERSQEFALKAFDCYERPDAFGGPFDSVFAVPLRANGVDDKYASDTNAFLPILSRQFGITPEIQLRGVLGVPPSVIETNTQGGGDGSRGATIFVPLFSTMMTDIDNSQGLRNRIGAEIMQKASELAHVRLGAKMLGLGATFPKISGYGALFKYHPSRDMQSLVTTTGHAGTVYLIHATVRSLLGTRTFGGRDIKLGVVGAAGSIGWATIETVFDTLGDFELYAFDNRAAVLREKIDAYTTDCGRRITQCDSAMEVLRQSDIIVSAVTTPINLDNLDPVDEHVPVGERSLAGKAIIDDSEPKAFVEDQISSRGGCFVGVVGESKQLLALRRDGLWTGGPTNPYNFGDEAGLYGDGCWGCDAERIALSSVGAIGDAVATEVTPADVQKIGQHFRELGIGAAPFQINSHRVHIP